MVAVNDPAPLPLCTVKVPLWPGMGEGEVDQQSPLEVMDPIKDEQTFPPLTALLVVMEVIAVVVLVQPPIAVVSCARTNKFIKTNARKKVIRVITRRDAGKCIMMQLVDISKNNFF
jgi:hypothetical protein